MWLARAYSNEIGMCKLTVLFGIFPYSNDPYKLDDFDANQCALELTCKCLDLFVLSGMQIKFNNYSRNQTDPVELSRWI